MELQELPYNRDASSFFIKEYGVFDQVFMDYRQSVNLFLGFLQSVHERELDCIQEYQNKILVFEKGKEQLLSAKHQFFLQQQSELEDKKAKLIGEINRYYLIFEKGATQYGTITPEISQRIENLRQAIEELIHTHIEKNNEKYASELKDLNGKLSFAKSKIENDFFIVKQNLSNELALAIEELCEKEMQFYNHLPATAASEKLHTDISIFSNQHFSPYVQIGEVLIEDTLFDEFTFSKTLKVITPFVDKKSILIIHDEETADKAENIHDTMISRVILSADTGNIKFNFCDVKGMGEFFREFRPITHQVVNVGYGKAKYDEIIRQTEENNIHIANRYTISSKNSDFSSLGEYNYDKIAHKNEDSFIGHWINVILNFSYDSDQPSVKKLRQILENSNKNGTQFMITWNKEDETDSNKDVLETLIRSKSLEIIDLTGTHSTYFLKEYELMTQNLPETKKHELVHSFNEEFKEKSQQVIKVRFKDALPEKQSWFSLSSHEAVQVPVGRSKTHRGEQTIDLKTNDFQAHVLMSGGNGSGKTNFMKTFITSAALNYSPEELEFYLIDLKNGVGFTIFNRMQLPHVKMYALGAENELILHVLDQLNDEMNRRLNLFRDQGVEDLHQFRMRCLEEKMPRTILIIDEFSTIFEGDNPLQDEICAKIAPLAKKARATGINMLLSTQNFGSVSHNFNKFKSEFPVRIVLKSSFDAAASLLDSRNDGMKNVSTVGDGLVNYRIGNKLSEEDNEFFKGYLLENQDLETLLKDLKEESEKRGYDKNEQLVYNNTTDADFTANKDIRNQRRIEKNNSGENTPVQLKKIPLWLGEPTNISITHFKIELEKNFNENIIISGINRSATINAVYNILSSLSYAFAPGEIAIRVISFLSEEENDDLQFSKLDILHPLFDFQWSVAEHYADSFEKVYREFKLRQDTNTHKGKRIFLVLVGLEKAAPFFKEDSYTLSEEGRKLFDMIENGPGVTIHTIAEIRQPGYLNKLFKSGSINVFKHRIVFHLNSADESMSILDSRMASSLYRQDEPYTKNRAIYYNADYEKVYSKFKPYLNLIDHEDFVPDDELPASFEKNVFLTDTEQDEDTDIPDFMAEMNPKHHHQTIIGTEKKAGEELATSLDAIKTLQMKLHDLGDSDEVIELSELK